MKKKWKTPQLIVLVRGKAEEAVLLNCKEGKFPGTPAQYGMPAGCMQPPCVPICSTIGAT